MESPGKAFRTRTYDIANNTYAGLAAAVIVAICSVIYTRYGAEWTHPIVNGLVSGFVVFGMFATLKAILSLPKATEMATPENIESRVVQWLHRFNLTVKRDPIDGFRFNYVVTTDGKRQIAVGRSAKEWPDYLSFAARLTADDDDKKMLAKLSDKERALLAFTMKLELARAKMGYSEFALEGFAIFKRVPITANLDEATFIESVWRMEAMINALFMVAGSILVDHGLITKKAFGDDSDESRIPRGTGSVGEIWKDDDRALPSTEDSDDEKDSEESCAQT